MHIATKPHFMYQIVLKEKGIIYLVLCVYQISSGYCNPIKRKWIYDKFNHAQISHYLYSYNFQQL